MNILDIENWKRMLKSDIFSTSILDEHSQEKLVELWKLTSIFQQDGTSSRRYFWIKADDYTIKDFVEYEDYEELSEKEIKKYYEEDKAWRSPWINVTCVSDSRNEEDDLFYGVFIDSDYVLALNDPNSKGWPIDATELIDWLIIKINEVKESVENGTYKPLIESVPYNQRRGIIKRKDLWDIVPTERDDYRNLFNEEEIDDFLNRDFDTHKYFEKITARKFYEACAVVYRALGYDDRECNPIFFEETEEECCFYGGVTPREMYYSYSDKRDDGLKNVPLDNEDAFKEWLRSEGPYYEFNGHHPWEIIPSLSLSNSLHLFVRKEMNENKFYLSISGATKFRSVDTIKGFLSLVKAGYPVVLEDIDILRDRLLETDYIGIVENTFFGYYGTTISGIDVRDFISLWDYYEDKNVYNSIIEKAKWEPLEVATLK